MSNTVSSIMLIHHLIIEYISTFLICKVLFNPCTKQLDHYQSYSSVSGTEPRLTYC